MSNLRARINKTAGVKDLKCLCVEQILKEHNVTLSEMSVSDVVETIEASEILDFDNIEANVLSWIQIAKNHYPETIS